VSPDISPGGFPHMIVVMREELVLAERPVPMPAVDVIGRSEQGWAVACRHAQLSNLKSRVGNNLKTRLCIVLKLH
jgi:hypothetical protein